MSGIYIPGLRVPGENEDELWIAVRSDGTVTFNAECGWTMNKGKAVSVPPHGRLVDSDALPWIEGRDEQDNPAYLLIKNCVDALPTIIPASKEGET